MFSRATRTRDALLALTFSLLAAGCPIGREVEDGGLDAAPAEDAPLLDASAVDAARGADAPPASDAPADASQVDATFCACDDGIACTRDSCDPTGACVHETDCPANEYCALSPTPGCVPSPTCTSSYFCEDVPCQPTTGCRRGFCQYAWGPDQDGDGNPSVDCGGTDCWPVDPGRPTTEVCNGQDDDCDSRFDEDSPVSSDVANCGRCFSSCGAADMCVDGECRCSGVGQVACVDRGASAYACFDGMSDPLHCGSCTACPDGSTCEAGLCRYRATWMHGVDVGTPEFLGGVLVAPNGDVLFAVSGRPTQLFHQGRATESIPPAPSPFTRHIVRLDRDGNLLAVTAIPEVWPDRAEARELWRTLHIAVTDAGFYFAGTVQADTEVLGTTYLSGRSLVGYVPRTSSTIAWVRPLAARGVLSQAGTRDGSLVLLVFDATDARPFERRAIRRFDATGAELAHDDRFHGLYLDDSASVFASSAGGFIIPSRSYDRLLPIPVFGDPTYGDSTALVYGATGLLQQAVFVGSLVETQLIFAERADANSWLVHSMSLREFNRTPMSRNLGYPDYRPLFAAFDESGVVMSDQRPALVRFRAERAVETVVLPGVSALQEGSAWLLNTTASPAATRPFLLPGATTTISRIDLPPIP